MLKRLLAFRQIRFDARKLEAFSNLKHRLINASTRATFRDVLVSQRKRLYAREIWVMHTENHTVGNLAENLFVALYSKFCTQRYILQSCNLTHEDPTKPYPDSEIKKKFRAILDKDPYPSCVAFDQAYLDAIKEIFPDDVEYYKRLNGDLSNAKLSTINDVDERSVEQFFVDGTTLTDAYLIRKLGEDSKRFMPVIDLVVEIGTRWRFLLAFISAGTGFIWFCYKTFYGSDPQRVVLVNDGIRNVEVSNNDPIAVDVSSVSLSVPVGSIVEFPPEIQFTLATRSITHSPAV
jgi:hypothetical protein